MAIAVCCYGIGFADGIAYAQAPFPRSDAPSPVSTIENYAERPSIVVLSDGTRFETTLYEVEILGALPAARKTPYLVLEGRGCTQCDANTSIYIHSSSDGPMRDEGTQPRYAYPGRVGSYEDGSTLVYEARTFIGDCLPGYGNAVVWFERGRAKGGPWKTQVLIVHVRGDQLREVRLTKGLPPVSQSVQRVKAGRCREVPGVNRHSEP